MTITAFQFDPTGQNPNNLVSGEVHPLTEANFSDFYFIIPNNSPFYTNNFSLLYKNSAGTDITLTENVDFYFGLPYYGATRAVGIPVYGAIVFSPTYNNGTVSITYQTIGGDWVNNNISLYNAIAQSLMNPLLAKYEQIANIPNSFPPVSHSQPLTSIMGMGQLVEAINNLSQVIAEKEISLNNQATALQASLQTYINTQLTAIKNSNFTN